MKKWIKNLVQFFKKVFPYLDWRNLWQKLTDILLMVLKISWQVYGPDRMDQTKYTMKYICTKKSKQEQNWAALIFCRISFGTHKHTAWYKRKADAWSENQFGTKGEHSMKAGCREMWNNQSAMAWLVWTVAQTRVWIKERSNSKVVKWTAAQQEPGLQQCRTGTAGPKAAVMEHRWRDSRRQRCNFHYRSRADVQWLDIPTGLITLLEKVCTSFYKKVYNCRENKDNLIY